MKYLESIRLVQFFLFERQDIRLGQISGIFGPNGRGKSSFSMPSRSPCSAPMAGYWP